MKIARAEIVPTGQLIRDKNIHKIKKAVISDSLSITLNLTLMYLKPLWQMG